MSYASAHGSTTEIAERIAERLQAAGHEAELSSAAPSIDLDRFDAVVVGSAIHGGAWLPAAVALVSRWAELPGRPVWLFSVSSVGDTTSVFGPRVTRRMRQSRSEPRQITQFRKQLDLAGHRSFAGVVKPSDWGLVGDLFVRALRGRYGDHRDWSDIEAWADSIAAALTPPNIPSDGA